MHLLQALLGGSTELYVDAHTVFRAKKLLNNISHVHVTTGWW